MTVVLDSSAPIALMEREPEAPDILRALAAAEQRFVSAFTVFETLVVILRRHGPAAVADAEPYIATLNVEIVPLDAPQMRLAAAAYAHFGKGIDPRARLNLGDCVSYALARTFDASLLFKGADFAATDAMACARRFHLRAPLRRRARASARLASRHRARAAFAASALRAASRTFSRLA